MAGEFSVAAPAGDQLLSGVSGNIARVSCALVAGHYRSGEVFAVTDRGKDHLVQLLDKIADLACNRLTTVPVGQI